MEIVSLRPEHIDALHAIYLAQVATAPHCCFAPDHAHFRDDLLGRIAQLENQPHLPGNSPIFVAEASDTVQGFATLATYQGEGGMNHDSERQAIAGLFFANEEAGHALIEACEARATNDELGAFPATHGNTPMRTYNVGWDGLSDCVPHVAQLLTKHGYIPRFRELNLIAPLAPIQRPVALLPQGISMTFRDGPAGYLGARVMEPMDGGNKAGACFYGTLARLTDQPRASRIGYIWELYIEEAYQRRGIARTLMLTAMNEFAAQGCTECWLTTTADNWRAQSLYYSLGFKVADNSVSFQKQLRR